VNPRPQPLPAQERRAATVEAVVDLAAEQNPADITTTAIAERMGLTQGALFRHFPNKDAILEAAMSWVSEHPGVPRMLFGELQRPGKSLPKKMVQTLIRQYETRLHGLLETGKAQGELDPGLDVNAAAVLFIGTIQGLVMQSMLAGKVGQIRRDARAVFAIYRRGIAAGA